MECPSPVSLILRIAIFAVLVTACGCDTSARSLHLDEAQARDSLVTSLEAWKAGKTPDDLKPEIFIGEWDWKNGKTLVDYEILADERSDGTNLHIPVRLSLKDPKGKSFKSDVVYVVGTSPVITISRQD
jgi:hypothetical protein